MAADPDLLTQLANTDWAKGGVGAVVLAVLSWLAGKKGRRIAAEEDAGRAEARADTAKSTAEERGFETLNRLVDSLSARLGKAEAKVAEMDEQLSASRQRELALQLKVDQLARDNQRLRMALEASGITQPGPLT